MSLPTHGRVVLDTTAGDIEIELWSKVRPSVHLTYIQCNVVCQEAPKAVRNFLALAMEGMLPAISGGDRH